MKNVVLVVDSRVKSGAGHVSRAIAIAEELLDRGFSVSWIVSDRVNFISLCKIMASDNLLIRQVSFYEDYPKLSDVLIVDSYDQALAEAALEMCNSRFTIQIVDEDSTLIESSTIRWAGSILSESSINRFTQNGECRSSLDALFIRNSVKLLRGLEPINHNSSRQKIVFSLGASEGASRLIGELLNNFRSISDQVEIYVSTATRITNLDGFDIFYIDPRIILKTAVELDALVISGGGLTAIELTFLNLEFLVVEVAENQKVQIDFLCKTGITEKIDPFDYISSLQVLQRAIFKKNETKLRRISLPGSGSSLLVDWIETNI